MVALDVTSAFDRCCFDVLFTKLEGRLPAILIRVLIFIYKKQFAWVRFGDKSKSEIFKIGNGTKQGSVLSPTLFSVYTYVQDLLDMLKNLGVNCHVGETFVLWFERRPGFKSQGTSSYTTSMAMDAKLMRGSVIGRSLRGLQCLC